MRYVWSLLKAAGAIIAWVTLTPVAAVVTGVVGMTAGFLLSRYGGSEATSRVGAILAEVGTLVTAGALGRLLLGPGQGVSWSEWLWSWGRPPALAKALGL